MRRDWLIAAWVVGALALLTTVYLGALPLIPIDETRYAGVALEMWQGGDFLVPRINGAFYAHKPPLLFWLMHAGWAVFGVSDWWPRVAVALCALAAAGLTVRLAVLLWPERVNVRRVAPVVLVGTGLWAVWAPAVMFDVLLTVCVLIALVGVAELAVGHGRRGPLLIALGLGLGILAKGPVVLLHVLPAAVLAPLWHRRGTVSWRGWYARIGLAVLGGAAIALAWAVPAAIRGGPAYAEAIFWGQSAGRMVDSFAHARPWWWYLAILPLLVFPWIGWLSGWRALGRLRPRRDEGTGLLLSWLVTAFVAFMLISGKQAHYLLPLLPGLALLLVRGLDDAGEAASRWWDASPAAAGMVLVAGISLWPHLGNVPDNAPGWVMNVPLWLPAVLVLIALVMLAPAARPAGRAVALSSLNVVALATIILGIGSVAAPWYDLAPVGRLVAGLQATGHPVAHVGKYHNRLRFTGRLKRPVAVIDDDQVGAWICHHPTGVVLRYYDRPAGIPDEPVLMERPFRSDWLVVTRARDMPGFRACPGGRPTA
ncbi:Undecaprenyl phosphate-alpha-4-amino-4-deoxy-L-arabinose arabinosyl transferase [wastewater metagenome]|uniref:Undecaprenyl phosphate-alpha-4-amino-4-deoxy-L-arabinose arabinosyl transferase n=2 Tax=unclassified sequences TaxID=12908 RepID=A0A5B8R7A3_9ZZZZ|nr:MULTISPECIES: glycosyltransferase family 39 protein [Arhodomonas]MCS4502764.1 glycosyltransferase family 39 protein [Arhodomonas aquaeolei]QEA03753.1 undecaprenyl phosphate-alpha-4-amino-4-deoxy-L-arabinose arabinosyl transferase [uncultured organism]